MWQEDERLVELMNKHGAKRWTFIARQLGNRVGKQCRERYDGVAGDPV